MSYQEDLPPIPVHRVVCIGAGFVGGPTMAVLAKYCPDIHVTVVGALHDCRLCDRALRALIVDGFDIFRH